VKLDSYGNVTHFVASLYRSVPFVIPLPASSCRRHTVFGLSTRESAFVSMIAYKCEWKFHQIYYFNAVGVKDELI